jgi:Asp-tRNA(Asn)/Glu-tRNA(Gln) amidotransferase A subunit family amidase
MTETSGATTRHALAESEGRTGDDVTIALGNSEPPAITFQAYPGGTGAYLEKLARERGCAAFERATFNVAGWEGPVPTTSEAVAFLPVVRLAALIKVRKLTSVDLTDIYLERLKRLDPILLCAVTLMEGEAREAAQQADAEIRNGHYRGPLHGIPWGVKDLFAVKGVRTTWGSRDLENQVIDVDSEVVVRLRTAGAILIAKLATGLCGTGDSWYRGQTRNPWNVDEGSGGSSAGPASATAAGCVGFSLGTETRGSIVLPAIRCGVSALRPTFGRVSRYGCMVLAWTMDKVGPMCRAIEDCALVFSAIHGADERDPATVTAPFQFECQPDLSTFRIGYDEHAPRDFIEKLRELGAQPRRIGPRPRWRALSPLDAEADAAFESLLSTLPRDAAADGAARRAITALDFLQAQRHRLIVMQRMAEFMEDLDMYVAGRGDQALTNHTGHPAVVMPYGMTDGEHARPCCITLIGNLFADDKLLSVAHAYQTATDWHTRRPRLG